MLQWQPIGVATITNIGNWSNAVVVGRSGHQCRQRQRRRRMPNNFFSQPPKLLTWIMLITLLVRTTNVSCSTRSSGSHYRARVDIDLETTSMKNDVATFREHKGRRNLILHKNSQTTMENYNQMLQQQQQQQPQHQHLRRHYQKNDAKLKLQRQVKLDTPLTLLVSSIQKSKILTTNKIGHQNNMNTNNSWWKAALSGSIAGAVATTLLYPLDAAKTLRQAHIASFAKTSSSTTIITGSSVSAATTTTATASFVAPSPVISSVYDALRHLIRQRTVYVGLSTAILGAIPSSALYFGAYETSKSFIGRTFVHRNNNHRWQTSITTTDSDQDNDVTLLQRCLWHSTSAAIGNFISSAVFVPKEVIKQQMQYSGTGTSNVLRSVQHIIAEKGIKNGLYVGYRATVLRNIPSAALRFTFYEELKRYINRGNGSQPNQNNKNNTWKLYIAGAIAGAMASGIMTPMDLIKTKLSTGTCPVNEVQGCIQYVIEQNGIIALWTGAGSRMISSALFSAIGFGTFEACQSYLKSLPVVSST